MQYTKLFERFKKQKVIIIGDVMIDAYLFGKVSRISPEAPVPVLATTHKESRLGGAANVALNIRALGAEPILCSVAGNDADGRDLLAIMEEYQINASGMVLSDERITTVKTRVIAQNHQMIRIDSEVAEPITEKETAALLKKIYALLPECDAVIFEDYDKGVIHPALISAVVKKAKSLQIPVIVDPKKRNFNAYKEVTIFKPNLKELREGTNREIDLSDKKSLEAACLDLMKKQKISYVFVTLSEHGACITDGKKFHYIPAHLRKIADVSGAGDTVVSVATLCMASKISIRTIAELANLAGGLVCEEVGVVPINKHRLLEEAEKLI